MFLVLLNVWHANGTVGLHVCTPLDLTGLGAFLLHLHHGPSNSLVRLLEGTMNEAMTSREATFTQVAAGGPLPNHDHEGSACKGKGPSMAAFFGSREDLGRT